VKVKFVVLKKKISVSVKKWDKERFSRIQQTQEIIFIYYLLDKKDSLFEIEGSLFSSAKIFRFDCGGRGTSRKFEFDLDISEFFVFKIFKIFNLITLDSKREITILFNLQKRLILPQILSGDSFIKTITAKIFFN
jgi:hypothetical protein